MDVSFYKYFHILGVFLVFQSLGAVFYQSLRGGETARNGSRKMLSIMHGIGLLLLLVAGFGMIAKLQIFWPFPLWLWVKFLIWLSLASSVFLVRRTPASARMWWWLLFALGATAALMGIAQPF